MKIKLLLCFLLLPFAFYLSPCTAQVPQGFNYQAIARDGSGAIIANTALPVKITIQTSTGTVIYEELFSSITSNQFGLISLVVGTGTWQSGSVATFSAIDWKSQQLYLKTTIQYPGTTWTTMGTSQIWGVPYSLVAKDVAGPLTKLGITGTTSDMEEALFEVKNKAGQTVFAVYNEGIRAYVGNGDAKGVRGGFSVGGYDATKGSTIYDLLTLNTDSARIYVDSKPNLKGVRGGFSVGGYDMTKDGIPVQNYFDVSKDSVRIYIDSNPLTKGKKGGFAVGGYDMTKGTNTNYMNVNTDASGIINPSQNKIYWYPLKNAFLTGKVLIEHPDSVGTNSFASGFESKAIGNWSQALGYKAIARGNYSTAIGFNVVSKGSYSYSFGGNNTASGEQSYAIGGRCIANGSYSTAMGVRTTANGILSMAFGCLTIANGYNSVAFGAGSIADGNYSTAMGWYTTAQSAYETVLGRYNTTYTPISKTDWNANDRLFVIGNGYLGGNSDALVVLKNGNLGIGTSTPQAKLEIDGGSGDRLAFYKDADNTLEVQTLLDGTQLSAYPYGGDTENRLVLQPKVGNVGIGTTTPGYKLQVGAAGDGSQARANAWNLLSDIRLKTNFAEIIDPLRIVSSLRGFYFNWNVGTDKSRQLGLSAQDVEKVLPEIVSQGNDGYLSIEYGKLTPVLIEAIKDQQKQITGQQQQIESQQKEIDDLKSLVNSLIANQTAQVNKQ